MRLFDCAHLEKGTALQVSFVMQPDLEEDRESWPKRLTFPQVLGMIFLVVEYIQIFQGLISIC